MIFLDKFEDADVDFGMISEAEMLGEAFAPIFEEIDKNFLISEEFYVLNENVFVDSLNTSAGAWSGEVMRYMNYRYQSERNRSVSGGDLIDYGLKAIRILFNFILFGLALLLVLAVIIIALGHLLVKVWESIIETIRKIFEMVWKIVKVRRETEVRDRLLTIGEKLDNIADKVSRDPKRLEEIRSLRYEILRMRESIGLPDSISPQSA
jgi:hypothetical protein